MVKYLSIALVVSVLIGTGLYLWSPVTESQRVVQLYYYNPQKDLDEEGSMMCSREGLESVERTIAVSESYVEDTLQLLLQGDLTEEERSRGINTEYPLEGLELVGTDLTDGLLTLTFEDPQNKTGGGSCRVGVLWFQIEATALQFSEVQEVRFEPEWLFQP